MADYSITAVDRRVVYSGSAGTGPYAFTFPVLATTDIAVYKDSTKLVEGSGSTQYTVTLNATNGTGSVTLGAAATSDHIITITGARTIERTTDFVTAGDLLASSLNTELDSQTIFVQQASEDSARAIKAPVYDPTSIDMTLPAKADRLGKILGFDASTGNPEATTGRVSTVSVSTSTVGVGGSATGSASYTDSTGALALSLGIPVGATGAAGDVDDVLTTRGDIVTRGASTSARLAIGSANTVLSTAGTDPAWTTVTNAMLAGSIDLTSKVTGALPLANGGTGATSLAAAGIATQGLQTIFIPAMAMRPTSSNGCAALTDVETTSGRPDLQVLDFDASSDEHAQFQVGFPKSWNSGTVTFRVFWTSAATDTDGVSWGLQGLSCADGDSADAVFGTAIVVDDANQSTAEDVYVSPTSSAVTIAGSPGDNELTFFRVFRDVSDANDTAAEDARLVGVQLFFTTNAGDDT